jgi:hypothetical protein
MTDSLPPSDPELEARLRDAFDRQNPPAAPDSLRATAERLADRPDERRAFGGWFGLVPLAMATAAIVVSVAFVGSLLAVDPSTTKGDDLPAVSPGTCPVVTDVDPNLIGGPRAFFVRESLPPAAGSVPWQVVVRIFPDIGLEDDVTLTARELDAIGDAPGDYVGRVDWPDRSLPGRFHLFTQPIPKPGCWQLIVSIHGEVAGSTVIEAADGPGPLQEGDFYTTRAPAGLACFGFAVDEATYAERVAVDASSWPAARDGTCDMSGIAPTSASIGPATASTAEGGQAYSLEIEFPRDDGSSQTIEVVLYSRDGGMTGVARNETVFLTQSSDLLPDE